MRKVKEMLHHSDNTDASRTAGTENQHGRLHNFFHPHKTEAATTTTTTTTRAVPTTASSSAPAPVKPTTTIKKETVEETRATAAAPAVSTTTSPYAKYGNYAPASVLNWQKGQPIPQGWRLGNKGILRPVYNLPPNLQSWQRGQPVPEGYRVGKRGFLKPLNYSFLGNTSSFSNTNLSSASTTPITHATAPVIEHREKAAVVQEVIKPGVREEIQPVIHRDREQVEIREELQPIYEKSVRPTIVEERQLAAEIKPEVRLGGMPQIAPGPQSSVLVEQEHREAVMKAPIVEETVHKKIIEEVQPVIHRETIAPRVIKEVKPIYEKVVEAPVVTYLTLPPKFAGTPHESIISSWQPGQPIPQGYRLGKRGYIKPTFTLPAHLQNWRQGQPVPEGYRVSKRGHLKPVNYFSRDYNSSTFSNTNPFVNNNYNNGALPAEVANWRQGQPIPQGWRLGRKGFLKPAYVLPAHLQNWQQGQPIPEGYRVGKRGTLKPLSSFGSNNYSSFMSNASMPVDVTRSTTTTTSTEFVPANNMTKDFQRMNLQDTSRPATINKQ